MNRNKVRTEICIMVLMGVAIMIGGCASDENTKESQSLKIGPVISSSEAKQIFVEIDHRLDFTVRSIEYLGVTDQLYYTDLMQRDSQVTINIGKREEDDEPFTNLYVQVMALDPMEENLKQKLEEYAATYIYEFLAKAFDDGDQLAERIEVAVTSLPNRVGKKEVVLDSEHYELNYQMSEGDKNPSYFDYELRITFKPYQEELNKRFSSYSP